MKLYPSLQTLVQELENDFHLITEERKTALKLFAEEIRTGIQQFEKAVLKNATQNINGRISGPNENRSMKRSDGFVREFSPLVCVANP